MNEGLLNVVLVLAAIYFIANTVLFIIVAVAAMKAAKALKDLQPRLEALTLKVEKASEDVSRLSKTVQSTVDLVGVRALGAVESAQGIASLASKGVGKYSPLIAGVLTALKIVSAVRGLRKPAVKRTPHAS